ncbi:MAG: acyl-CoA dehydratase activase-related protein, partial [Candidatus Saganbacteria bacterium]|nr:acyl-CoA dehydratase activase-related protein [Candidatus Saganbacteria bacterium]
MKRIGIPRALLYYKYFPLWKTFFENLGFEIVISPKTSRTLIEEGFKMTLTEFCLPVKLFHAHVFALRDKVDCIFIPRLISIEKKKKGRSCTCPKLIGLPDLVCAAMSGLPPIVPMTVDVNRKTLFSSFYRTGRSVSARPWEIIWAYVKAKTAQSRFESLLSRGASPSSAIAHFEGEKIDLDNNFNKKFKIALISHPYNICETYMNMDIINILGTLGVSAFGAESLDKREIELEADKLFPDLSWTGERELLGAASLFARENAVDGMIMILSFGCGPSSLVCEFIRSHVANFKIPFMSLVLDEHTARGGMKTRLEAFVDMLERTK